MMDWAAFLSGFVVACSFWLIPTLWLVMNMFKDAGKQIAFARQMRRLLEANNPERALKLCKIVEGDDDC